MKTIIQSCTSLFDLKAIRLSRSKLAQYENLRKSLTSFQI